MNGQEILESFMPSEFPLESFELVKIEKVKNTIWSLESQLLYPHRLFYYFEEKDILPKWYEKNSYFPRVLLNTNTFMIFHWEIIFYA